MVLKVELTPELEHRLLQAAAHEGIPPEEYVVRVLGQHLPLDERRRALVTLLDGWLEELKDAEPSSDDDEFLLALDAERPADRRLYPPELKGITW